MSRRRGSGLLLVESCLGHVVHKALILRMMRTKELVEEFQFRIIDHQVSMMVIMIFAIKNGTQKPRGRKTRMSHGTVDPVQGKVAQMNPPHGRGEEEEYQSKTGHFHDEVFDNAVVPGSRSDQISGALMMLLVVFVECRMVQSVMNGKRPNLSQNITGNELDTG